MTSWGHEFFRQATELFQTTKQNISKHIQAIYDDQELNDKATVNQQLTVQKEGEREVSREITLYNLDVILAVGYCVRSVRGVQFRRYVSTVLKEYLGKGFVLNDERLKNLGGGNYWKSNSAELDFEVSAPALPSASNWWLNRFTTTPPPLPLLSQVFELMWKVILQIGGAAAVQRSRNGVGFLTLIFSYPLVCRLLFVLFATTNTINLPI